MARIVGKDTIVEFAGRRLRVLNGDHVLAHEAGHAAGLPTTEAAPLEEACKQLGIPLRVFEGPGAEDTLSYHHDLWYRQWLEQQRRRFAPVIAEMFVRAVEAMKPMTEQEWLTSDNPARMLSAVREPSHHLPIGHGVQQISDRKLRLFAVACCRAVWDLLTDDAPCGRCHGGDRGYGSIGGPFGCIDCNYTGRINRSRRAVEAAERMADGGAISLETDRIQDGAEAAFLDSGRAFEAELAMLCVTGIPQLLANAGLPRWFSVSTKYATTQAALLREIVGNPFRSVTMPLTCLRRCGADFLADMRCAACGEAGRCPWLTDDTRRLAAVCYDGRDFSRLPVVADMLEEAGCDSPELLEHLRRTVVPESVVWAELSARGNAHEIMDRWEHLFSVPDLTGCVREEAKHRSAVHVRGCWATDLLLGKS